MTDQHIYEVLINAAYGYKLSEEEYQQLLSVRSITWSSIRELPQNIGLLKNITNLNLRFTGLSDISALSELKALTNLDLSNNRNLTDISALSNLTTLTNLNL